MTTDSKNRIIGAIIGDIVGSTYEFAEKMPTRFKLLRSACSFTDDTVLTVAIADALLHGRSFADAIEETISDLEKNANIQASVTALAARLRNIQKER